MMLFFILIFLIPAIAASNNKHIENCIAAIKNKQDFWAAVSLSSSNLPETYPTNSILSKLKIPYYTIDFNVNFEGTLQPKSDIIGYKNIYFIHVEGVNPNGILHILHSTGFWNHRNCLVIFCHHLNKNVSQVFNEFYRITQVRTVNVLLVSVKLPGLSIEGVYYKNPFLNKVFKKPDCSEGLPNYFKNLHGYQVNVSFKRSINYTKRIGFKMEFIDGIELRTALGARNGNIITMGSTDGQGWGGEQIPLNGILGDVSRAMTVMHINPRLLTYQCVTYYQSQMLEYTYPRAGEALVAFIPYHWNEKKFLKLQIPFLPYILVIAFSMLFYLYSKFYKNKLKVGEATMMLLALVHNQGVSHRRSRPYGLWFMNVLLMSAYLNILWTCSLSKYLTVPSTPKFTTTIEEMVYEHDYPVVAPEQFRLFLSKSLREDLFFALKRRFVNVSKVGNMLDAQMCQEKAFVLLKTHAQQMHRLDYLNNKKCFGILPEELMPAAQVYAFSFGSPFLPEMDRVLSWMSAAGLIRFFWKQSQLNIVKEFYTGRFYTLGMEFVGIGFGVLFWGWGLGLVVFIGEWAMFKMRKYNFRLVRKG